jgi:hypothetical protein
MFSERVLMWNFRNNYKTNEIHRLIIQSGWLRIEHFNALSKVPCHQEFKETCLKLDECQTIPAWVYQHHWYTWGRYEAQTWQCHQKIHAKLLTCLEVAQSVYRSSVIKQWVFSINRESNMYLISSSYFALLHSYQWHHAEGYQVNFFNCVKFLYKPVAGWTSSWDLAGVCTPVLWRLDLGNDSEPDTFRSEETRDRLRSLF